jgi:hypothetical protein
MGIAEFAVVLLHGGWDTIAVALLFWALVIGLPLAAIVYGIGRLARRRKRLG